MVIYDCHILSTSLVTILRHISYYNTVDAWSAVTTIQTRGLRREALTEKRHFHTHNNEEQRFVRQLNRFSCQLNRLPVTSHDEQL